MAKIGHALDEEDKRELDKQELDAEGNLLGVAGEERQPPAEHAPGRRCVWLTVLVASSCSFAFGVVVGRGFVPMAPPTATPTATLPDVQRPRVTATCAAPALDVHKLFGPAPQCPGARRESWHEEAVVDFLHKPKVEIFCASDFLHALETLVFSHLGTWSAVLARRDVDIVTLLSRAKTGVFLNRPSKDEEQFHGLQRRIQKLIGHPLKLMQYEFLHPTYKPQRLLNDPYAQLYELRRLDGHEHLPCPQPLELFKMNQYFPQCPAKSQNDIRRMVDGLITGNGLIENSFKGEWWSNPDYDTRVHKGELDPTLRLRHGLFQWFAGTALAKYPTDLWCYQSILWEQRPDVIVELGTSQGGSTVWFAATCKMLNLPCEIHTTDLPLGAHRKDHWARASIKKLAVEDRVHFNYVPGGSTNRDFREQMKSLCKRKTCMVVSDSWHIYEHTYPEMEWYSQVVSKGQYLVVEDTNIAGWNGWGSEAGPQKWPFDAANDFAKRHPEFTRTDWCTHVFGLTQQPMGWFYRNEWQ